MPMTANFLLTSSLMLQTMGIGSTRMTKSANTSVYYKLSADILGNVLPDT